MSDLTVMICDDQEGMQTILQKVVERTDGFTVCALANDGKTCIEQFIAHRPKVVFLDVEMPYRNGLECAKLIQDIDPLTFIIFATAFNQFMDQAFELYAFDYLVKPFKVERVTETLGRIKALSERPAQLVLPTPVQGSSGRIMLKQRDAMALVDMQDIILVQRENRTTAVYTAGDVYQSTDTLTALESKLDMEQFFRCHKSYIINLSYVDNITPYGRWTYIVRLKGLKNDALITHEKFEELKNMFG